MSIMIDHENYDDQRSIIRVMKIRNKKCTIINTKI